MVAGAGAVLSNVIASQGHVHLPFRGVKPDAAQVPQDPEGTSYQWDTGGILAHLSPGSLTGLELLIFVLRTCAIQIWIAQFFPFSFLELFETWPLRPTLLTLWFCGDLRVPCHLPVLGPREHAQLW